LISHSKISIFSQAMLVEKPVNYPDPEGLGLIIPNFVSGLTDDWRFTPTDTELEDKPNGRQ
jgi:hypothetical protein